MMWYSRPSKNNSLTEEKDKKIENLELEILELKTRCSAYAKDATQMEQEVKRLTEIINGQTEDCKIGPWCEKCIYREFVSGNVLFEATKNEMIVPGTWIRKVTGVVRSETMLCMKHVHELCPGFEGTEKGE